MLENYNLFGFIYLKILKLDDVIKLNILKFTYEFNHNLLPSDISNIFDYNSAIHKYKTRSATNQGLFFLKFLHLIMILNQLNIKNLSYGMIYVKAYLQLTMFTQWHLKI